MSAAVVVELVPAVQVAVNEELGRAPGTPVTDEDMAQLTRLAITHQAFWAVPNLPNAIHLEELDLSYSAIMMGPSDQAILANLPSLRRLNLSHNAISDLRTFAELDQIEELNLNGNRLTSLEGVKELESLRVLRVGWNAITDFNAIENHPTLEGLYIGGNRQSGPYNHTPVAPVGLRGPIQQNEPGDLSFLATLSNLRLLGLEELPLTNLSPIAQLTQLEELNLNGALRALEGSTLSIGNLTKLQVLDLSNNELLDVDLSPLTAFRQLYLSNNLLSSVDFLEGLNKLELIDITNNRLDLTANSPSRIKLDQLEGNGVQVLKDSLGNHLRPTIAMTKYQSFDDPDNDELRRVVFRVSNREHLVDLQISWSGGSISLGDSDEGQLELPLGETTVTVSGKSIHGETHSSSIRVQVEDYGDSVYVPDSELRREIYRELELPSDAILTRTDMLGITSLNLIDKPQESFPPYPPFMDRPAVTTLEGLQYAENLVELQLRGSYRSIISPIFKTIQYETHYVHVQGWEALYNLPNLRDLRLYGFRDFNLDLIVPITTLESLSLSGFVLREQGAVQDSWQALRSLPNLRELSLDTIKPPPLEILSQLAGLERLSIDGVYGKNQDLSPLASLDRLKSLSLNFAELSDVSWISSLSNLEELYIRRNQIEDLAPLSALTKLRVLDVSNSGVASGEPLRNLENLEFLNIGGNPLLSLDFLKDLPALDELIMGNQFFTEATKEYDIIQDLRDAGVMVDVKPLPVDDLPFTIRMQVVYVDGDGDGEVPVTLTVYEKFKNTLESVVWRWNDQEQDGAQLTTALPLGETRVEIDYRRTNGNLYRHNVFVRVVEEFSWDALSMDEYGNVDTGSLVGWINVSNDSGWVWSWPLNRMIYLHEDLVSPTGVWFYAPHNEEAVDSYFATLEQYPNLRWVDTFSFLSWIYAPDRSGWVWVLHMSDWVYLPEEELKPAGTWMFSSF